ncbi:MAG: DUF885 domain-containing protein [Defluviitaleaceae bacterium]|nr:DUF885 domain-containing protein [Defluviitaleaceae bacterium]
MRDPKTVKMFRLLDKDIAQFAQKVYSSGKYEKTPFVPTEANRRIAQAEIDALTGRVQALASGCDDPVYDVLRGHFTDFIDAIKLHIDNCYENPGRTLYGLGGRLYGLCGMDYRADALRADILMARMKAAPMFWHDGISPMLNSLSPEKAQNVLVGLTQAVETMGYIKPKLAEFFKGLPESQIAEILSAIDGYLENLNSHIDDTRKIIEEKGGAPKSVVKADDEVLSVTREEYRNALKNHIGVDLDELLSWYEDENAKTRAESLELANKLKPPVKSTSEVNDVLFKYAGPCDTPEEMFARANTYLKRTRAAAHEYVWLPEDEICECVPIPEMLKDSYPWGGYSGDYPSRYPLYHVMFLNNHNYTAVTDGWIKLNTLHEAYPGHHVQFIRASIDPIPETFKRGAKYIPLIEGVCMRTERVFEFVFAEDPFYPLMVTHRRHHTSTRIKVDLWLHYFGKTIGEACDLYEKEMGFDRKTARAQVQAHENMMGYFTSYYYGLKKLCDWEKEYGWDKREYTELLFSVGRVSLETFEKILKLSPQDRHSLQHDFASLIQFS